MELWKGERRSDSMGQQRGAPEIEFQQMVDSLGNRTTTATETRERINQSASFILGSSTMKRRTVIGEEGNDSGNCSRGSDSQKGRGSHFHWAKRQCICQTDRRVAVGIETFHLRRSQWPPDEILPILDQRIEWLDSLHKLCAALFFRVKNEVIPVVK